MLPPSGILWANARPCEFYALEDLAPDSDTPGMGGVKTISATGRTFSVFVTRRGIPVSASDEEDGSDGEHVEEGEETEFAMIDGRESENVNAWIRKYRARFGKTLAKQGDTVKATMGVDVKGKGKARAEPEDIIPADDDESDASDEDYAAPSDSDGGEPSSDSEGSDNEEGGQGGANEEEEAEDSDDGDAEEEEEEELDPARHPLLRPGAMPNMSKAAMDAAVSIVMGDMGRADIEVEESEEEEVDELE